jgi:brefeldin A-inhibited guanine nucleotide-exchange protein
MMITTNHCEVHEASLLLSVRACFHIHLISKNLINKTTAKAALTQIISVTHQRMEIKDAELARQPRDESLHNAGIAAVEEPLPPNNSSAAAPDTKFESPPIRSPATGSNHSAPTSPPSDGTAPATESTADLTIGAVGPSGVPESASVDTNAPAVSASTAMQFSSVYHKDAYLLFRALCKLSMKGLSEDAQYGRDDAIPLQNKYVAVLVSRCEATIELLICTAVLMPSVTDVVFS